MRARITTAVVLALLWPMLSATCAAGAVRDAPVLDVGGVALPGGASTDRANPAVVTAGVWADTLGAAGSVTDTHYFRYRRTMADSTIHLGVAGSSLDTEDGDRLGIRAYVDDEDCGERDSSPHDVDHALFGPAISIGPRDRSSICLTSPTVDFAIDRDDASSDAELPIVVQVVEEAPALSSSDLLEEDAASAAPVDSVADPEELPGSKVLDEAPTVAADGDGAVIATSVREGTAQVWRTPLTWGNRLDVTVRMAPAGEDAIPCCWDPTVQLVLVDARRDPFWDVVDDTDSSGRYDEDETVEVWSATPRVAYLNRYEDAVSPVPGDHWIAVHVSDAPEDRDPIEVPMEITLRVSGEVDGAPAYPTNVTGPGGQAPPAGYDAETPYLVGEERFAAVASGSPANAGDDPSDGWWGARRAAGLGLGALSLASMAAGVLWLRRTA